MPGIDYTLVRRQVALAQVLELAQRNQFTIYCISTQAFGFTNETDANLVKLSTETGGRTVYPLTSETTIYAGAVPPWLVSQPGAPHAHGVSC